MKNCIKQLFKKLFIRKVIIIMIIIMIKLIETESNKEPKHEIIEWQFIYNLFIKK